ncbi:MAG: hypothetical protein MSC30_17275, partial [Gaiellaceae bacterium MAG52_C11]|nr:hypothetical protein [Candidatus Gaiellasilicea maunaloa]
MRLVVIGALVLAFTVAPATAAPPTAGVLVPGSSLGGLRLDATATQVEAAWGRAYGICDTCRQATWYFNYLAFEPRGVGVEFRRDRAVALFTLHSPPGWRTQGGLALGAPVSDVRGRYPAATRVECDGYYALVLRRAATVTAFYVLRERLWA